MAAQTIGSAYVQILPSAQGIQGNLEKVLSGPADVAGAKAGKGWSGAFSGALKAAGAASAAAIGAASAGITAIGKAAFDSYADYEQLVGGVDTLFKASSEHVQEYAAQAYKTAGLSANEYMETTTSFAASLLQSLGGDTKAAADMADMAITDMADNANKMGSDMSTIQTAYQGFAKQNYTMLDNLKLGYGGTQQEMFRLLQDAADLNEEFARTANFSIDSKGHLEAGYADIVQAIHIVQDEMGITGTTAKEASETISGSIASLQAAWDNVLAGFGNDKADFDRLVDDLVESAMTAGRNVLPRVEQILQGAGKLVERLAPVISDALPSVVRSVVPSVLESATTLVGTFVEATISSLPTIGEVAMEMVQYLATTLGEQAPNLIPAAVDAVLTLVDTLIVNSDKMVDGAFALIEGLATGLIDAVPLLVERGPELVLHLVEAIIRAAPKLFESAMTLDAKLSEGIHKYRDALIEAGMGMLRSVGEGFFKLLPEPIQWGADMIDNFVSGINKRMPNLQSALSFVAKLIRNYIGFSEPKEGPLSNFHTYGPDMMEGYANDITSNAWRVRSALEQSMALGDAFRAAPAARGWTAQGVDDTPAPRFVDGARGAGTAGRLLQVTLVLERRKLAQTIVELGDEERQRIGVRLTT